MICGPGVHVDLDIFTAFFGQVQLTKSSETVGNCRNRRQLQNRPVRRPSHGNGTSRNTGCRLACSTSPSSSLTSERGSFSRMPKDQSNMDRVDTMDKIWMKISFTIFSYLFSIWFSSSRSSRFLRISLSAPSSISCCPVTNPASSLKRPHRSHSHHDQLHGSLCGSQPGRHLIVLRN